MNTRRAFGLVRDFSTTLRFGRNDILGMCLRTVLLQSESVGDFSAALTSFVPVEMTQGAGVHGSHGCCCNMNTRRAFGLVRDSSTR